MFTSAFNAIIALIDGRYDVARGIIRSMSFGPKEESYPALEQRLCRSLEKVKRAFLVQELKLIQRNSLRIEVPEGVEENSFLQGVDAYAELVDQKVSQAHAE